MVEFSLQHVLEAAAGVDGFISPASFGFPDAVIESAWHQHAPFAFWLMEMLQPRTFVELGAHHGFSYLCFCQAASQLGLAAKGYAVDTWQGDEHAGFYDDAVFETLAAYHNPRYGQFSRLVRSTFDDALPHFIDGSIDLLHIDGRHFYDDVKHDFESWRAKLSDRAVVMFHDTNVREQGFGVFRYWPELCERYPAFEFLHGHGLGVLGVGDHLPERINKLFTATAPLKTQIRNSYARLGAAIEDRYLFVTETAKLAATNSVLNETQRTAHEKANKIADLERALDERGGAIAVLTQRLAEQAQLIAELKRQAGEVAQERATESSKFARDLANARNHAEDARRNADAQIRQLAARYADDLKHKMTSSRWLFPALVKLIIHAPRDISRRWRKSWQKRHGVAIPEVVVTKRGALDFRRSRNAQYRKYASSRLVLRFERALPRSFANRMRKRMEKNAPLRPLAVRAPLAPDWTMFETLIATPKSSPRETALLDVIIPVYRGYAETLSCIYSVLSSRNITPFELVVIDDASPEPALSDALGRLARMGLITLLRNEKNLGFVGTVNRGMAANQTRDVLLLNSDTLVANDWLDRIRAHALLPDVASVTPFTNNGTICSYPEFCKDNPHELEVSFAQLDLMAAAFNRHESVEVPTGVGFCMYITRRALKEVGLFDAETFGRGYGEENDFCVKASKLGMRNLHALDVFTFHSGETSFGEDASEAKKNGLNALVAKHPTYLTEVAKFIELDSAKVARTRLDIARMLKGAPERIILCFTHTWGGGVERYLRDRAQSAIDTGEHLLLAVPHPSEPSTIRLTGVNGRLALANLPDFSIINSEESFTELLKALPIVAIEVHSTVGWSGHLLRFVPRIATSLEIPFDFMAHDYVAACPQINLINESGIYCGEQGEEHCGRCLRALPKIPLTVHPDLVNIGMDNIAAWRAGYYRFLKQARRVLTPSDDAAKRLQTYFPEISLISHPPKDNIQASARLVAKPYFGGTLEVVVIGAIGPHKGSTILQNCADDALRRSLPIHFTIVGTTDIHDLGERPNVSVTGRYAEHEVFSHLARVGAHVALFPSVWPETYCYTLSIAIAGGFPICAFDIGAPAQRLRSCGNATLLPTSMMTDAAGINDMLLKAVTVGLVDALAS